MRNHTQTSGSHKASSGMEDNPDALLSGEQPSAEIRSTITATALKTSSKTYQLLKRGGRSWGQRRGGERQAGSQGRSSGAQQAQQVPKRASTPAKPWERSFRPLPPAAHCPPQS